MISDEVMGESLQVNAMIRFCFNIESETLLDDEFLDYGGIKIQVNKKTDAEKIERFASTYSQAQWMINHMANLEMQKIKKALGV